jgi:hypothetical protein
VTRTFIIRQFCSSGPPQEEKTADLAGTEQAITLDLQLGRSPTVETEFVNNPLPRTAFKMGRLRRDSYVIGPPYYLAYVDVSLVCPVAGFWCASKAAYGGQCQNKFASSS